MSGTEFASQFVRVGLRPANLKKMYKTTCTEREWTRRVFKMLHEIASENDFQVSTELTRWDQAWVNRGGAIEVIIEHENYGDDPSDTIQTEITKLLYSDAPLRVLITYVSDFENKGRALRERILNELSKRPSSASEFLLLLAPYDFDDPRDCQIFLYRANWAVERI